MVISLLPFPRVPTFPAGILYSSYLYLVLLEELICAVFSVQRAVNIPRVLFAHCLLAKHTFSPWSLGYFQRYELYKHEDKPDRPDG